MTAAGTPAGRGGPARPGQAAAERVGPGLQKAAVSSPGRSHPAWRSRRRQPHCLPHSVPRPAASRAGTAPCSPTNSTAGPSFWGPRSPTARARYASVLFLQLGPALPASAGLHQDGVGAAPPSPAMGRPLGTEQPPEA